MAADLDPSTPTTRRPAAAPTVLALMAAIAALAIAVDAAVPAISGVIVAIVLGILVRTAFGIGGAQQVTTALASKRALQLGIVLLGSGLSVADVVQTGGRSLLAIVLAVAVTLVVVAALARRFGVSRDLAVLLAAGTAICGATAIMALAPLVRARATEISFAIATITIFGTAAIAAFPLVGHALGMSEHAFGVWAGMAIHETAQVIAAGFQYGDEAGATATIVKLTRTTLLVPLALALAAGTAREERRRARSSGAPATRASLRRVFPWFILGFVAAALVNSLGWIPSGASAWLPSAAKALITFAMAGVGLNTDLRDVRRIGPAPLTVGLVGAAVMGIVSFALLGLAT